MRIERLLQAVQKGGQAFDTLRQILDTRLQIESAGAKRRITWTLEPNKEVAQIRLGNGKQQVELHLDSGEHSTLEAWEEEDRCGIRMQAPRQISWEVRTDQLDKLTTGKAAGLACAAGALAGFCAWLLLLASHKLMESPEEEHKVLEKP